MNKRVGIIGTGWVGTSVAISTLHSGATDELWLHDMRTAVAEGEAMDLAPRFTLRARYAWPASLKCVRCRWWSSRPSAAASWASRGWPSCATTPGWSPDNEPRIAREVRTAAYEVIQRKGATNHAIGLVTASLLRCMLRGERRVLTVSRVQDGALGLHGVAMSLPTLIGLAGGTQVVEPSMIDGEREALLHSAAVLRQAMASLTLSGAGADSG